MNSHLLEAAKPRTKDLSSENHFLYFKTCNSQGKIQCWRESTGALRFITSLSRFLEVRFLISEYNNINYWIMYRKGNTINSNSLVTWCFTISYHYLRVEDSIKVIVYKNRSIGISRTTSFVSLRSLTCLSLCLLYSLSFRAIPIICFYRRDTWYWHYLTLRYLQRNYCLEEVNTIPLLFKHKSTRKRM